MVIARREPTKKLQQPRTVIYGAPIMPIFGYMEKDNGKIIKHLLGMDCELLGGAAFVEECDGPVIATVRLDLPTQTLVFDFPLRKGYTSIKKPFDLQAGTRIAVTITSQNPDRLAGVWVTLMFKFKHSRETAERLLLEVQDA